MPERPPQPWEENAISQAAAETAAGVVVKRHKLASYEGEPAMDALCWSMGEGIDYGQALREFGQALLTTCDKGSRPV